MRSRRKLIGLIVLMVVLVTASSFAIVSGASDSTDTQKQDEAKTISANGEGKVFVKPDIAYITIGVQTEASDAKVAQKDNAAKMDKVVKAVKTAGIEDKDVQTQQYSISPKYQYNEKPYRQDVVGYTVNNSIKITIRDISKVGDVLDKCVDSGANVTNSIQFSVTDQSKFYNEALKMAVSNAKGKAEAMASVYDIKLGAPSAISENSSGGVVYQRMENAKMMSASADSASTPIAAGDMEISANVSLTYKY